MNISKLDIQNNILDLKIKQQNKMNRLLVLFSLLICLNYYFIEVKASDNEIIQTQDIDSRQNSILNPIQ